MSVYGFTSSSTVLLESGVHMTADSEGRERTMRLPNEALKVVERPLREYALKEFVESRRGLDEWKVIPLLVSC